VISTEINLTQKGNWTTNGPNASFVDFQSLGVLGNNVIANTTLNGIYFSNNNGGNWLTTNNGLPITYSFLAIDNMLVTAIIDSNIFLCKFLGADTTGLFISSDSGRSWSQINNGLPITELVTSIVSIGNNLFAGTYKMGGSKGGIYISSNKGNSWIVINNGLPTNVSVRAMAVSGNNIFAATDTNGIFLSNNNGNSWIAVNNGILTKKWINTLVVSNNQIFAGTSTGVLLSSNNGTNWTPVNNDIPTIIGGFEDTPNSTHIAAIYSLVTSGNFIFALAPGIGVYFSIDNGATWSPANNGLVGSGNIGCIAVGGTYIFAGTTGGTSGEIWRSILTAFQ